jgi:hypothetical protein
MRARTVLPLLTLVACLPRPPVWDSGAAGGVLELEPGTSVDFGELPLGCERSVEVYATNVGTAGLEIRGIDLGDAYDQLVWQATDEDYPWEIAPSDRQLLGRLVLQGGAEIGQGVIGTLTIRSDDAQDPEIEVGVEGSVVGTMVSELFSAGFRDMDILLTLDRSGSMADEMSYLTAAIPDLVDALNSTGISFRLLGASEIDGCFSSTAAWIDNSFSGSAAQGLFEVMVSGQPAADVASQGLLRAENALSEEAQGAGGCNEGFLRQDAMLHVVGMSDQADTSPGDPTDYAQAQIDRKKFPNEAVYHGIGAELDCGEAQAYEGFLEAASLTQGHWVSFCDGDWWDGLQGLLYGMINRADRTTFVLDQDPITASIAVGVGGESLSTSEWSFDEEIGAVVLSRDVTPAAGTDVRIEFYPQPVCE